jgi:thiosulfate/3-mercaptopyruvate sulfurtransferase
MLEALGHPRVAVLDGGIAAWRTAGLPLTTDVLSHPAAAWPAARPSRPLPGPWPPLPDAWPCTIDRAALTPRLGTLTLLDARAAERYRGEIEPVDPVPGHIPTAVSAPTASFLGPDGRFLAPEELAARFAALDAAGARPVVVTCGSGVNACQLALAMRVAGLPDPLLYPGSYSDWSRAGMPIATGDAPGEPPSTPWPA